MTYSYTQISHNLTCPRQYRHRYLNGWKEKDIRVGGSINRGLTLGLVRQMGALQIQSYTKSYVCRSCVAMAGGVNRAGRCPKPGSPSQTLWQPLWPRLRRESDHPLRELSCRRPRLRIWATPYAPK